MRGATGASSRGGAWGDPIPLAELAVEFGVSGERVRQIEVTFEKVQKAVKNRVGLFEKSSSAM